MRRGWTKLDVSVQVLGCTLLDSTGLYYAVFSSGRLCEALLGSIRRYKAGSTLLCTRNVKLLVGHVKIWPVYTVVIVPMM